MSNRDLEFQEFVIQHTAEYLTRLRKEAGVSQVALAGRLNKKIGFVMRTEDGRNPVRVTDFLDIVDALGFKPAAAFKELVSHFEEWKRNRFE